MVLKQEAVIKCPKTAAPQITDPFKGILKDEPHRFYRRTLLSRIYAGYRDGPRNPYVEKLMAM